MPGHGFVDFALVLIVLMLFGLGYELRKIHNAVNDLYAELDHIKERLERRGRL
ncbi:MAG: hypothetical protein J2P47_10720 [Acetobacteraceae bacterium]|nr:hypothetical protein [Acetobacteraceae bacterium]